MKRNMKKNSCRFQVDKIICFFIILTMMINMFTMNVSATASNDYTQWRQGDAEWNQAEAWPASQYSASTLHYMSEAGCLVTSIAMLLRHYNVVVDSNVNNFNPWICNETLKAAGAFDDAADLKWNEVKNAYPGFEYVGYTTYSAANLVSLYNQGYACIVQVLGSGGYMHFVAVKSASSVSDIEIMDPGWGNTSLSSFGTIYSIFYFKATPTDRSPVADINHIIGGADSIAIRGWAFDADTPDQSVAIHVYVDDVYVSAVTADQERTDVHGAYGCGNYHGFEAAIPYKVMSSGVHTVTLYALNTTSGQAALNMGSETVVIAPTSVFTNVSVSDITEDGYTISCDVNIDGGINRVQFPTWTMNNGQDDLDSAWESSTSSRGTVDGNHVTYRVNISDHNNETGLYFTNIYAYGNDGTYFCTPVAVSFGTDVLKPVQTIEFNGNIYEAYIVDKDISSEIFWTYAKTYAESIGGHLVTITSQEEQNAINTMLTTEVTGFWIGGSDEISEDNWQWVTGEEFTYANWQSGQPSNGCGMQDYLVLRTDVQQWDDEFNDSLADDYGFIVEYEGHSHAYTETAVIAPNCTEAGLRIYTCECGDEYTEVITALGHNFTTKVIEATCVTYEQIKYTCTECGYTYSIYGEDSKSSWSTQKPVGVDESLIESKMQYRYSDYETVTSYETAVDGFSLLSSSWEQSDSGNVNYVKSWPSGFSTIHGLYSTYNQSAVAASETDTNKTVVNSDTISGYLYYHWCRGTYSTGPINRGTSPVYTSDYVCFHAFYSTTTPGSLTASSDGDGSYIHSNSSCCVDSYWYYAVPVYTQTYTNYRNLFTYYRWTEWSAWSDTVYTASDTRKVETQTLYRYVNTELAEHTWDEGCTENGMTTYTCSVCGEKKYVEAQEIASGYSGYTTWSLSKDGVLTFSGEGDMKNYTYKSEMPWYNHIDEITSVVLEDGVTSIGSYAFYGMPNLKTVTIPESVTTIGAYAFKNSTALNEVSLPSGLTKLGESAFYGCTSMTGIEIPASLWTIQPYTFKNCTALAEVTFHEGNLQKISDAAFYGTALTEVSLPDCLDILDVYVFKNCSELASVTLSESMTQIREAAFYGTAIQTIEIPEGTTSVGAYAFKNCTNLVSIQLPASLTSIGEASFYNCNKLATLVMPDNVTSIGNYAFRKCSALQSVQFAKNLITIGESSFYGCSGLTALSIPEGVITINGYAFKSCTALTSVNLPSSLITLGESALYGCTALTEIAIPENVATVGDYCFSRSTGLTKITFIGNAPAIGTGAFSKVKADVYYPVDNATWTTDIMQSYGGTLKWITGVSVLAEKVVGVVETQEKLSDDEAVIEESADVAGDSEESDLEETPNVEGEETPAEEDVSGESDLEETSGAVGEENTVAETVSEENSTEETLSTEEDAVEEIVLEENSTEEIISEE